MGKKYPKYEMGQEVWFMEHNKVYKQNVTGIIEYDGDYYYLLEGVASYQDISLRDEALIEEKIFCSKEKLIESL